MNRKEYDLSVTVKETLGTEVFAKTYRIALRDTFVENKNPKEHNLVTHIEWMLTQLKLNALEAKKIPLKKREVYVVSFGIGTWSEILANRPSIIYKSSKYTKGDDVTVIPLTSAVREKLSDAFDILVQKDNDNKLFQNSYARLRQVRAVSMKKIGKMLGVITDDKLKNEINAAMQRMLWIDE